jgi:hypothetical protein
VLRACREQRGLFMSDTGMTHLTFTRQRRAANGFEKQEGLGKSSTCDCDRSAEASQGFGLGGKGVDCPGGSRCRPVGPGFGRHGRGDFREVGAGGDLRLVKKGFPDLSTVERGLILPSG